MSPLHRFVPDFDAPAAGGVIVLDELDPAEAPPPEPAITPEMLAAAIADARAEGLAAGRAEAETAQAATRRALKEALHVQLRDADTAIRAAVDEAGTGLARLVLASLAAGFPALCARHGAAELARFTRDVVGLLAQELRVVIRAHPAMQPALDEVLDTLEPEQRAAILIEPRTTLAPGDARIAWRHGMAVRDAAGLQARLTDILAPLGLALLDGASLEPASPGRAPGQPAPVAA